MQASATTGINEGQERSSPPARVALVGNPNTGKTTLFNRLTGLRHKTSNFPGTTLEARLGRFDVARRVLTRGGGDHYSGQEADSGVGVAAAEVSVGVSGSRVIELIDLPGIYSLELEVLESQVCREALSGRSRLGEPDAVCVVVDATSLSRNLRLAGEALRRRLPTVVAVNMIDLARRRGLAIDTTKLAASLGCAVVLVSARTGEGLAELRAALAEAQVASRTPPGDDEGLFRWADEVFAACASGGDESGADTLTDRLDRAFTHPVLGVGAFALIMGGLFYTIFSLASFPMNAIDWIFTVVGGGIESVMPAGLLRDLLVQGVVGAVGATVIFLPQICLLFFMISLLEDTGYLARAAFVMDRVLRPFGLAGHSFVPLLSSHACALPGIMSCRAVPDPRERLATILVAPFMTCAARLPVYVLLTSLLFPGQPLRAALAFMGCYALGIAAGVGSALLVRRTILRGKSRPMALELPSYKLPSVRTALVTTYDRGLSFIKNAGTNILAICIVLWWLGSFPHVAPPTAALELRERAALVQNDEPAKADLEGQADRLAASHGKAESFLGQIGRTVQPVFAPLGFDWQLTVGVMASFAAREVFVSTMSVVLTGREEAEDEGVFAQLSQSRRTEAGGGAGRLVFDQPTAWSLLVFFVLAMQCLPTLVVTAKESGNVKWALLQLAWMSGVAYAAAFLAYRLALAFGGG